MEKETTTESLSPLSRDSRYPRWMRRRGWSTVVVRNAHSQVDDAMKSMVSMFRQMLKTQTPKSLSRSPSFSRKRLRR